MKYRKGQRIILEVSSDLMFLGNMKGVVISAKDGYYDVVYDDGARVYTYECENIDKLDFIYPDPAFEKPLPDELFEL